MIENDTFCPRHGRRSRPKYIEGLRCDCDLTVKKCGAENCFKPAAAEVYGIVCIRANSFEGVVAKAAAFVCQEHLEATERGECVLQDPAEKRSHG